MIRFDEKEHRYYDGEKELISVSALMRKHGLTPDYSGIPEEVLRKKAERGSFIHKEIDTLIKTGKMGFTDECENFFTYITSKNFAVVDNEFIVYNDLAAGTVDLLLTLHDETIIADIKTTSTIHTESVSWQLSIYNYLSNRKATKGLVFHFDSDGKLTVKEIPLKPIEEVERLFEAERNGEKYAKQIISIDENLINSVMEVEKIITEIETQKKQAEERRDELKAKLMQVMEESGTTKFETDKISLTYIAPTTKTLIDSAKLKKELPEIAEKYSKTSTVKASLRITLKGEQE